jgi:hypothetical protein
MKTLWRKLKPATRNAIRAGATTAGFSFVVLFGATVIGWSQDVTQWASDSGASPFPGLSVLGYGAVSAAASAAIGAINGFVRWAQGRLGMGTPPNYDSSVG